MPNIRFDLPEIAIAQNIPDAICVMGMDFTIQCWNQGAQDIFGYTPEEIIGKHISTIIPPEIAQQEIDHCVNTLNRYGKMPVYESVRLAKDGRKIPVELSAVAIKEQEKVTGYATIMRDITERKRMQEEIEESQANQRILFNSTYNAVFVQDLDGRIIDVNEKMLEMYRVQYDQALALSIERDYSAPENPVGMLREIWKKVSAGESTVFPWKARRPSDGSTFDAEVFLKKIKLRNKDVIMAVVRDTSEQKKAEESLELIRFGVDRASASIYLIGPDAHFLYVNDQACETLGYSHDECLSLSVPDVDPHFPASAWDAHWEDLRKQGRLHIESEHRRKDGSLFPVEVSINYFRFGDREYNWAFAYDISERKRIEEKLRESEERYRSIVETSTDWIWEMDALGRMTFNNPAVRQLLGYEPDELLGKNPFPLMHSEDREKAELVVLQALRERRGWRKLLLRWQHRDGTLRYVESNAAPILNAEGGVTGFRGSDHDVTEIVRAEEALRIAYGELEQKVRDRTRQLAKTNEELQAEVTERRRAVELIRRSKELSDALNKINAVIYSTLDFEEIMKRVVKDSAEAIQAEGAAIGLIRGDTFHIRHVYKMAKSLEGWSVRLSELGGVSLAASSEQTIAFNDAVHDKRLNRGFIRKWRIQSMLVSPLIVRKRMAGAIVFYSFSNPVVFLEEHIDFGRKLAASIALSLENAELYRALGESRRLSESRLTELRTIYETAPVGLCFIDRDKRYISINRRLAEINEVPIEETIGRRIQDVVKDPAAAAAIVQLSDQVLETGTPVENVEILRKKETGFTVSSNFYPVKDPSGAVTGLNIVVQDITERKRSEEIVRRSEGQLKALLNSIPDMAWLKDREGRFILVNEPFAKSSGKSAQELTGKTDFDAWPRELADRYRADDEDVIKSLTPKRLEEPLPAKDGAVRWIETIKTPIYSEKGAVIGTAGIARDTTERRRMEEEIRQMALHDPLTGLPNRRLFLDILGLEIAQTRRHKSKLAVLFIDLDRFKEINDTLGHDLGDRLLKHVAGRFRSLIRESDTVARIGGDEFNMILSDIARPDDVSDIAAKIVHSLAKPILLKGHELHVTASVGISIYPDDSEDMETLVRYADIAMYHAKEQGRNKFQFYNPSINVSSLERMKFESYLRQTVKRGELSLLYQPQIDIRSRKIFYAEALVRWNHPERGVLEPSEFIPLAEETGFITSIDEWVLETVCRQAAAWKKAGLTSFCVTVNLSARAFQSPDLVQMIASDLREAGLAPECLDLEITEGAAMSDVERSATQLRELRDMGVHVSIDDFGTGYSSLNYLKKLPIERLKIDKSFVQDIAKDADDRAIISAVTSMARKMGIRTVAEGVETEEQLAFVTDAECDEAQGFLFSEPVTPEQFAELVGAEK